MAKTRRERYPNCCFLDAIKWRRRGGHQRYARTVAVYLRSAGRMSAKQIDLSGLNGGDFANRLFHRLQSLSGAAKDSFTGGLMTTSRYAIQALSELYQKDSKKKGK